jgi:hypothetical protein
MTDQIEMYWKCSACDTVNGGLSKRCGERVIYGSGCGKPLDHKNWFMPEDLSKNLTVADHIKQAKEGPDWKCEYCGSTQRNSLGDCAVCGGDREFSKKKQPRTKKKQTSSQSRSQTIRQTIPYRSDLVLFLREFSPTVAGVILAAIAIIGILIWAFTPKYIDANVKSVAWSGKIDVERYRQIQEEGWDPPYDGENLRQEGSRIHHYDRVKVGSHDESYNVSVACGQNCTSVSVPRVCTPNNNGTASCTGGGLRQECTTKYCDETRYRTVDDYEDVPRYQMWYSWYAWRWRHHRTVRSEGVDLKPYPPTDQIALNEGCIGQEHERHSDVSYSYECLFSDVDGKYRKYYPTTEFGFKQCTSGRKAKLKLVAGNVSIEKWY